MGPKKAAAKKPAAPAKKTAAPKVAPKKGSKTKDTTAKKPGAKKGKDSKGKGKKPEADVKKVGKPTQLFESRPKNYTVGQDLPHKRDLSRFVRWPAYIKRQRQKRILLKRLRVPPAINQFNHTVDRHLKKELFKFALKYKPESAFERRKRLKAEAEAKLKDPKAPASLPGPRLYCGAQRVFRLVEQKRAKLVLIAHDVDPIEIVLCLPALCRKQGIPWCIVKGKANLGRLVGLKTATCVSFVDIKNADKSEFEKITQSVKLAYNDRYEELSKKWGGLRLSKKSKQQMAKKKKLAAAAAAK
eukprot:GGOE01065246.1.p1 GENE.GGOE01065246.1~~GGOE01065246.1.p1  ORF type:complete len:300 (-),score=60.70 GGOE01065246.1:78-977(-)